MSEPRSDDELRYPLGDSLPAGLQARSGRPLAGLTLENLRRGELSPDDMAISSQTLLWQARIAEVHGFRQLAENLRRASELTRLPNEKLLALYEALRPRRSTRDELLALAEELRTRYAAPETAALVVEAAEALAARGLCRPQDA
jgi:propanediol dehydratase small subunit